VVAAGGGGGGVASEEGRGVVGRDGGLEPDLSREGRAEWTEVAGEEVSMGDETVSGADGEEIVGDPETVGIVELDPDPTLVPATDAMLEIDGALFFLAQNDFFCSTGSSFTTSFSGSPSMDLSIPHQSDPFPSSLEGSGLERPMGRRRVVEERMEEEERWVVRVRASWKRREVVVSLKGC